MKNYQQDIISMFQDADNLLFYKVMKYPVPKDYHYFLTNKSTKYTQTSKQETSCNHTNFSRRHKSALHDEYIQHIQRYKQLYRSLPFIEEIYLCNSLTFNGLREGSDIDLFIITKTNALRRARFFSVAFFFIRGILRKRKSKKKFCLSFYITNKAKNLYNISLDKTDIYLAHRITHLYPLYQKSTQNAKHNIYHHNKRIQQILPNTKQEHKINLDIETYHQNTFLKNILEFLFGGFIGKLIESLIRIIRSPIVITKKKLLGENGKGIIIAANILKFYSDKRQKIRLLYQLEKKNI